MNCFVCFETCKDCNFRDLRYNKKAKMSDHLCLEANEYISELVFCPLSGKPLKMEVAHDD